MSAPRATVSNAVRLECTAGVARLVLDRPPLNVLDLPLLEEFDRALAQVGTDPRVKVLVLSGAGRAFCAGADVGDHLPGRVETMLPLFHTVCRRLLDMRCPTVAAVHGAALGGGCELAIACDLVVAREDASFGVPETRLGVFPPLAAVLLPRLIGRRAALDLVLTGRTIGAGEAAALGIVSLVAMHDEFERRAAALIDRLAAASPPVLRLAKQAVLDAEADGVHAALDRVERLYLDELMREADAHEGLTAFLEKRTPRWQEA